MALRYVNPAHPLPHPLPPAVTEAGLAALGLPAEVRDPVSALRAAIRCLLPWRRPALRLRPRLPAVSIDDPDDGAAPPRVLSTQPEIFAAVSAENERSWEGAHRCADTAWDAVIAWTARVGQPLDVTLRGGWRLVSRGDGTEVGWAGRARGLGAATRGAPTAAPRQRQAAHRAAHRAAAMRPN